MAFLSTFLLIIVLIIRPQEIWPWMGALHLLDVLTALSALGVAIDFFRGRLRSAWTPQLPFLFAFIFFAYFSTVLALGREGFSVVTQQAVIAAVFMLVVAYGAGRTVTRLRTLVALLLLLGVFVSAVAIQQGREEPSCLEVDPRISVDAREEGIPDGRTCETRADCTKGGRPEFDYECEKLGMFKTVSVERRVRWRGQLGDPNEMSVFLGAIIPFAFALAAFWRKSFAVPAVIVTLGLLLYAIILSQSRGGQLVVGTVFAVLFYRRFGLKGLLVAGVMALPVLVLGGREGVDADSSADERREVLYDAITAVTHHPLFGGGIGVFAEDRGLTAHNAYVLAAADLGLTGFYMWAGMLWASLKMLLAITRRPPPDLDPRLASLASAVVVSFAAMAVGVFFLSFTYKQVLFIWIGLSAAIYGAVREDHPDFEVTIGWRDLVGVGGFVVGLVTLVFAYTRLRPP